MAASLDDFQYDESDHLYIELPIDTKNPEGILRFTFNQDMGEISLSVMSTPANVIDHPLDLPVSAIPQLVEVLQRVYDSYSSNES